MLQFISPLALVGLTAIAIPLIIHLLSRKKGKTVKVGSVRLLQPTPTHRLRTVKLQDLLLLLMRTALLALLALFLAQPIWVRAVDSDHGSPGWVLVSPQLLAASDYPKARKTLDSLLAAGKEPHLLDQGFPRFSVTDSIIPSEFSHDYWSLVKEADLIAPQDLSISVLVPRLISAFKGQRPSLIRKVAWHTFEPVGVNHWIEDVVVLPGDSVKILLGASHAGGTRLDSRVVAVPNQTTPVETASSPKLELGLSNNDSSLAVRLIERDAVSEDNEVTVPLRRRPKNVVIFYDQTKFGDAKYVRSALEAVFEFRHHIGAVEMRSAGGDLGLANETDWVFWLADTPVPEAIFSMIQDGKTLFTDALSTQYIEVGAPVVTARQNDVWAPQVYRRERAHGQGLAIWWDGFGEPLLQLSPLGSGRHFRFYCRFDPFWTDLVSHEVFPELMMNLLESTFFHEKSSSRTERSDRRAISAIESVPRMPSETESTASAELASSLQFPLWLLLVSILGVERWLSERRKPT